MIEQYRQLISDRIGTLIQAIGILVFCMITISYTLPLVGEIWSLHQDNQKKINSINKSNESQRNLSLVDSARIKIRQQIDQLVFSNNQESQLSKILSFLSLSAKENKIDLLTVKPNEPQQFDRHVELSIQISLTATYHGLGRFISAIENASYITKVEKLTISTKTIISKKLDAEILFVFHFLKDS